MPENEENRFLLNFLNWICREEIGAVIINPSYIARLRIDGDPAETIKDDNKLNFCGMVFKSDDVLRKQQSQK